MAGAVVTAMVSPTLNVVIDLIVREVVLKEALDSQPLPVDVFNIPANQPRHVLVESKSIGQRQGFNCLFNFL